MMDWVALGFFVVAGLWYLDRTRLKARADADIRELKADLHKLGRWERSAEVERASKNPHSSLQEFTRLMRCRTREELAHYPEDFVTGYLDYDLELAFD
ncbi:hypothetical protein [Bradyrhizobium brasilense]|uniref:hypothetical protein n=1 Tax=Bradyrhizobium brasilense TaxID=1419277 RepID=UPI001E466CB1|nr:hypothetical protein [Bradyrhizobium brasilense]MCC8975158.1 hypothetical protein [Bradyrhizobium brasilense]